MKFLGNNVYDGNNKKWEVPHNNLMKYARTLHRKILYLIERDF